MAAADATTALSVEVSDDSLSRDLGVKQRLYARCGIPACWKAALPDTRLEVYRDPSGDGHRTVGPLRPGGTVAPLAWPAAAITVADLLP